MGSRVHVILFALAILFTSVLSPNLGKKIYNKEQTRKLFNPFVGIGTDVASEAGEQATKGIGKEFLGETGKAIPDVGINVAQEKLSGVVSVSTGFNIWIGVANFAAIALINSF